jgi:predicted acylesterase/phospholipase RssA
MWSVESFPPDDSSANYWKLPVHVVEFRRNCALSAAYLRAAMNIQVAFQGGGARLALLLPIVDSLLTLERAGEIRINGTAGTSAGAVAAALVAGNANMDKLRTLLKTRCQTDPDSIRKILPPSSWPKIAKLVLFKWPFAKEEDLAAFLVHRHIQKIQGPLSLGHAHHRNRRGFIVGFAKGGETSAAPSV